MWKYLIAWTCVCHLIKSAASQSCPRAQLLRDGTCTTPCVPSTGCPEPNSDCLCDGQCGFSCVKKGLSCGRPPKTRYANSKASGTSFNDTVVYTCRSSYTMNGDNKRRCTAKGSWSGVGPSCLRVCEKPVLPFGAFIKSTIKVNYKTGESIILDCKKGFKKVGTPRRMCISGRWTAFPFECIAKHSCRRTMRASRTRCTKECFPDDPTWCPAGHKCLCDGQCGYSCVETGLQCKRPNKVKNGFIKYTTTGYNDTLTYKCQINFTLNGDKVRRCTAKKRWSGAVPSCLPDCGQPMIPVNAYIENKKSNYASGDRVTFKCKKGFNQEGIATTLCFMGKWNVMPFRCDKGGCGDPGVPENGNKVGISYAPGSEVFFSCNIGYIRVGSEQRRCLENRTWSGTQPKCKIVDCGVIPEPRNGTIVGKETTFQKLVSFSCDEGFELNGNPSAICQSDRKWSSIPKCEPVDCGRLDAPSHGSKKGGNTTFTNKVEFSCDPGYNLIGSTVRYCTSSGDWNGTEPKCQAVNCGSLKVPLNGSIQGNQWTFPNSVRFFCDKGFDLIGSSLRKCQTDATWGGQPVKCQAVDCGKLEIPQNGSMIGSQTRYPVEVEFRCDEGFILKGSQYRQCLFNRVWSGKLTNCEAVRCGKPSFVTHGVISGKGLTYPNTIRYECEEGYFLNGRETRQCQSNGIWSGQDPTCEAKNCGVLTAPMNGSMIGNVFTFPSDVFFNCDKGFDLVGSNARVCLSNGSWSGQDTFCKAVECGPLAVPMNGSSKGSLHFYPNVVMFQCDKGFNLRGSAKRRCQENRKWSGDLTTCEAVDCGPLHQPTNGSLVGSATVFPNKISFSCEEGFLLKGSGERVCLANGKWSGEKTRCEAVDCGFLLAPKNGSKRGDLTYFPNRVIFYCDKGFKLIGSKMRTCLKNGRWSGRKTFCKAVDCGPLAIPMNGSSIGNLTVYPNKIKFSCDEGFILRGSYVRKCLHFKMWSGYTAFCEAIDCGALAIPVNGTLRGNLTVFPNIIKFTCRRGFNLIGSSKRKCQSNGTWSGTKPFCKAKDCGSLDAPMNGTMIGRKTTFPNSIRFSCYKGFDLIGSPIRKCLSSGKWSGMRPKCKAVDCGALAVPMNGSIHDNKTVFPNSITLSCDKGFDLIGSSVRTCMSNRKWNGSQTSCKAVDCGRLAVLQNGSRQGSLTVYPNIVKFSCDEGFLLRGSMTRVCQADRTWSGSKTQCEAIDCGILTVPMNGSMVGRKTYFPNSIKFSCDEGFDLMGSPKRTCLSSGKWSGKHPTCKAVDCGALTVPMNGSIHGNKTSFTNNIRFSCDKGFDLIGSSIRTCMSNRKWNGSRTSCKAVDCGPLAVPQNGSRQGSLTVYPNIVKFSCDEGFILRGSSTRVCQANRTWNGSLTQCKAVDCGPISVPTNGSMFGKKTVFPNSIKFGCDNGFNLIGSKIRKCLSSGKWSGIHPTCKAVDCGALPVPMNGSIQSRRTYFPNIVQFSCDVGFDLIGSSVRMCLANGYWSGNQTTCKAVDCGPLAVPQNGSRQGSLTVYPNIVKFSCDKGFLLRGSMTRACQANRTWNGSLTQCEAIDCGPISVPTNGSMFGKKTVFPNSIKFGCENGFNLIGSKIRKCLSSGKWSGIQPTCKAVDCGALPVPMNGSIQGRRTYFPNTLQFSCDEGFDLMGSSVRMCLANGSWSGDQTTCKAVDCGPLAVPRNGTRQGLLTVFPNIVKFMCDAGFLLRGSSSRLCQANRTWSGSLTICEAIDCGPLPVPTNGSTSRSKTVFPNIVKFNCDKGFYVIGSSARRCLPTGEWSGNQTICKAVDCGPLPVPQNGSRQGSLTVFPNTMVLRCNKGFLLRGSSARECQANMTWSGSLTTCEAVDCGAVALPINGSKYGNLTIFPNSIKFSCDEGFDLIGSSVLKCMSNGKWDQKEPTCKAVDCGPLRVPQNGFRHGSVTVFPNVVTFSCDEGFLLRGPSSRICQANRTWSGIDTRCEAVDCGSLAVPLNGSMHGTQTVFPNSVAFDCDEGFDLIGSSVRNCLSSGKWDGNNTTCKAVDCGPLAVPQNGSRHGSLTVFPNVVRFMCDKGFLLRGSSSRVCQSNRTWSGIVTQCEAIDCGPLPKPTNGSLLGNKTVFPNILTFSCDKGFYLIGSSRRACLSNGNWSGTQTKCKAVDCGPIAVPQNGSRRGSLTVFPNVVSFSCDEGFLLRGSSSRICQANMTWSGTVTRCEAIDCGYLAAPMNGSVVGDETVFPNSKTFQCDTGFDLIGSSVRTCLSNGSWSGHDTSCRAVDCGILAIPMNGSRQGFSTVFPNVVKFSCDVGFLLLGSSSRICLANRTWSGTVARCEDHSVKEIAQQLCISDRSVERIVCKYRASVDVKPRKIGRLVDSVAFTDNGQLVLIEAILEHPDKAVDCGPLAVPQNGSRQGNFTTFPNIMRFNCDDGFLLRGSSSRSCQANRTWNGLTTRCEAVNCGSLAVPRNGSIYGNRTVFPSSLEFKCEEGFDLLGSSIRSCLSNGMWNGNKTTCKAVDCGPLTAPNNGSKEGDLTVFPNAIKFTCDEGFFLRGSSSRICQANRAWSGRVTRCQAVDCGALVVPRNGSLQVSLTVFPNVVKFSCDEGFLLRGSSLRICQANRTWSGTSTHCEAVNCGKLVVPMNGSMYGNRTVFPNSLEFRCDAGFDLIGPSLRSCLPNGNWSGNRTTCKAVDCGPLAVPQNGSRQASSTLFPNVAKFSCDEGFLLRGSSLRVCQANRTWSGNLTRCEAVDCGFLAVPMNGSTLGSKTVFPSSVTFDCDEGFDLIGSSVRNCLSSGKWDGNNTTCKAVDCGPLAIPQNGSRYGSLTVFPNVVRFMCDEGFLLRGSSSRVCQSNRTWSGIVTRCEAIDCGPLSKPINGSLQGEKTVFPNVLTFNCDEGFDLIGSSRRSCLSSGNWSGTHTKCKAVDCGPLDVPQNGSRHESLTTYLNVIKFVCDEGFLLHGSSSRVCQANRKWNGSLTRCEAIDCGYLAAPMNGSMVGDKTAFPNSKTFQCDTGFDLIGSSVRTCLSNGNWSGQNTSCKAVDCGPLAVPLNGSRHGSITVFPNAISFSCDEGFLLRGSSSRVCQSNRTWSGRVTRCEAVDCGFLFVPMNGSLYGNKTYFPNIVAFKCDVGFDLIGSSVRTCLSNGKWSGNPTICKAVDCGPLVVPQNGSRKESLTIYPNVVKFSCDKGFLLRGSSYRICQANRTWSGSLTRCEAVDCGPLSVPINGSMDGTKTVFPNSIRFNCDEGFDLLGSFKRKCLPIGKWSGKRTTCRVVDCGPLVVPKNGSRQGSLTVYPNIVKFSCDEGFLLRGSMSRFCQANRTWNGSLTQCEAVDCGALPVPMNGSIQGRRTYFPNTIQFSCDVGFDLIGSSVRICLANGNWSGNQTSCKAVDCGPLAVPQNGSLQGSLTVYPNIVKFSCDEGFVLRGSSTRVCQANRTWNGSLTQCEAVNCGPLSVPTNGSMFGKKTVFPNSIKFGCENGFNLIGSKIRKCLSSGKWSGIHPTCKAVDCGALPVPINGFIQGRRTYFPNTIRFSCDEGFDLIGSSVRMCLANGNWSGNQTTCKAVECGPLTVPQNGSLQGSSTVFPNVVKFSCDEGFLLRGSTSRACQANRTWSGSFTSCEAIDCGSLAVPMNGSMFGRKTFYPNSIKFKCDEGFDIIGSTERRCLSNGKWSGSLTTCKAVDCGSLETPMNGSSNSSSTVYPNVITFSCDKGFILKGSSERKCQANGVWSGAKTVCEVINCGSLLEPRNGFVCGERTVFPHSIKFHCDSGFYLVGSPIRRCQANGVWSGTSTYCRAVDCGPIEAPMNGTKKGSLTVFPNIVKFACDEGFILEGSNDRICQANGTWSGDPVRCDAVDCGFLPVPINGVLHGIHTVFPNIIKFSCNIGYDLIGSSVRQCQSNGFWNGSLTSCKAVDCGLLKTPTNGRLAAPATTFSKRGVFTCDDGFLLKGNSVRVCQANKTWSGNQPLCQAVDCGKLEPPKNGAMKGQLTIFPNNVTFSCDDGFELVGSSDLQCLASGLWSKSTPTCKAIRCNPPEVPPKSYLTSRNQSYFENDRTIYFSCKPGFFLRGKPKMTCRNGKWTKSEFLCLPPKCKPPRIPANAYITFPRGKRGSYVEDDEVYFTCNEGYYLIGKPSITCKKGWTAFKFSCNPVECGPLPQPKRGLIVSSSGTTFGQRYVFGCQWKNGFKIEGSQVRVCQANKQWDGIQPYCYLLSCGEPNTPEHGMKLDYNYTYNNVVRYRCDRGYSPRGYREIRCQINSRWTGTGLICLECTAPLGMANRKIPREKLQASSERDPKHSADRARLFDKSAWCSARSEFEKFLQIDFESTMEVTAISTQGHPKEFKWVHKYYLKYALGAHWFEYRVKGEIKIFQGNKDRNTVVKRHLERSIVAKKLRLYRHEDTKSFSGSSVCLRMEVYGCKFYTTCLTIGTKVLARWYKWRKQTTYIMGYVSQINENTIGIIPQDAHSSLTPGTALMISKKHPFYILADDIPKEKDIQRATPVVMLLRGQNGAAIYPTGKVMNKIGDWFLVNLDNGEISFWRKLSQIRLMKMPERCDTKSNNKLEIK